MKTIVIKRYLNRKLYNTASGSYITLPEIMDLIREGLSVQVVDKQGCDITRSILNSCLPFLNLDIDKATSLIKNT